MISFILNLIQGFYFGHLAGTHQIGFVPAILGSLLVWAIISVICQKLRLP